MDTMTPACSASALSQDEIRRPKTDKNGQTTHLDVDQFLMGQIIAARLLLNDQQTECKDRMESSKYISLDDYTELLDKRDRTKRLLSHLTGIWKEHRDQHNPVSEEPIVMLVSHD